MEDTILCILISVHHGLPYHEVPHLTYYQSGKSMFCGDKVKSDVAKARGAKPKLPSTDSTTHPISWIREFPTMSDPAETI